MSNWGIVGVGGALEESGKMTNDEEEGPSLKSKKQNFTNSTPMIVIPPHRVQFVPKKGYLHVWLGIYVNASIEKVKMQHVILEHVND